MDQPDIEAELKALIVDVLALEDVKAADIDSQAAIFGTGLGLDSIDALELALAIGKKYGVKIKSDDERNREIFGSVRNLATFITRERAAAESAK
jgi:acyl carrier protein